ncbi:DNA-binding transcriptional LysR family regulator [Streptomyces sp. 1114.5]|uniref:LysR family transcriptional regulator n=1 Tax=unclassified Streptomyces TaxID=2593676 RepID=UPI000BDB01E4|nr:MULTISPECIES: LysR family transcriptional regulator [unclassified Streptomyces]RKT09650.1 DNA-binding transcriptional LysR family regulator [Streptomyces sp. 1114.5]SOB89035.1 DNA-binding transcriptional regulator, LysR family [Streptomyces sp. 1331.2]
MDRIELEAFVVVAEELHFGRAAARLHRGQPTVSDAVRRLENALGGRLFHRTSRRVELTELGEALLPDAHAALAQLRRFQQRGRALAAGGRAATTLVVAHAEYTGHQLLLRCLPQLRERFPDVAIVPETMPTTAQLTALRAESIGLGIGWATDGITGVRATVLSTERFMALVPDAHPLAGRSELSAAELSTTGLLTWPHQINSGLCDRLLSAFHIGGADLRIIRTADSVHDIAAHVAAGTGIGITVESALDHRPSGLRVIPLTGPSTTADQVVLTPAEPSEAATALRDLLLQAAGQTAAARR